MADSSFFKTATTNYTEGQGSIATAPNAPTPGPARSSFFEAAGAAYSPSASITGVVSFNGRVGAVMPLPGDYTFATGVVTFNGRGGSVVPLTGDYTFTQLASKPTTLSGYGITDALTLTFNGRSGIVVPLTGDYTFAQLASKPTTLSGYGITDAAPLASPALTGTPTAPTASIATNTTQIATTAFVIANTAGATFATEAQAETGTSTVLSMNPATVSQAIQTNALGFKNVAGRNGGFEVWQLGASVAIPAANNGYTCDGWYAATGVNTALTVTRQPGLTNGSSFSCRVQRNSGQTGTTVIFGFPLDTDELKKLAGQSAILQFTVSTGANWSPASGTLTYQVVTGTATPVKQAIIGYSGTVAVINSTVNLSVSAAATTVYSAVAAVASNIAQAEIQFSWTPSGTAGANDWLQLDDVDLRVVPVGISAAKPAFERSDFIWDIERCIRHFEKSYDLSTAPGTVTTNGTSSIRVVNSSMVYTVLYRRKRALPTVTTYSSNTGASGMLYENGVGDAASTINEVGGHAATFSAPMTSGNRALLHWVADARI